MKIEDWLSKLGLSEYAARFAENGIDLSVLPYLTDHARSERGEDAVERIGRVSVKVKVNPATSESGR